MKKKVGDILVIEDIKGSYKCCACSKSAVTNINGDYYCKHCSDALLMKLIFTCVPFLKEVNLNTKLVLKGVDQKYGKKESL